jgi:tetratricopeptide (TPR) repeat protein
MSKEVALRDARAEALAADAVRASARSDWATAAARWREVAALRDLEPLPDGADDLGGPHQRAGDALMQAGRPKEAIGEYERSLQQHPGHVLTVLALARARAATGDVAAARRHYERAVAMWAAADADYAPAAEARAWLVAHPAVTER